ncbi:MAG: Gfo/Idh/MocA family oxidoreductase [Pseudomonadota bacterium]
MAKTLRYGIIGSGMMGQEHIRNIALLPDAEVTAVLEPDPAMRARTLALVPGAAVFDTLADMLADVDAVVVATPNDTHIEMLEAIRAVSDIPVLLEKPLFTNARTPPNIEGENAVWVAMEYRYMPIIASFIEEVAKARASGETLRMFSIREHRFPFLEKVGDWNRFNERTGGTLVEKCCHFFDLMRLVIGTEPIRVFASGAADVNHRDETYGGRTPDIIDNAFVVMDFACGARASLDLCMFAEGSKFQERLTAITEARKVDCNVPGPGRFWPEDRLGPAPVAELIRSPRNPSGEELIEVPVDPALLDAGDHNGSTFYQHERFAHFVRGNGEIEVTMDDGYRAVRMGQAAQESIRTGEAVSLIKGAFAL